MLLFNLFPEDILNEIIDSVQDLNHVKSLHNLALTSHLFLPRSQYHLFAHHVVLNSTKTLDSFCEFLNAHPDRRPWIRSVTVYSTEDDPSFSDVVPLQLFQNLPRLYQCRIGYSYHNDHSLICPSPSELQGPYSRVLTHLHLHGILFPSYADFARYILAFPALRHLVCENLHFKFDYGDDDDDDADDDDDNDDDNEDNDPTLVQAKERLFKESHVSQLTIRGSEELGSRLLLESRRHALQELVIDARYYADVKLPRHIPYMSHLTSITLETEIYSRSGEEQHPDIIKHTIEALEALASVSDSQLTHVTIHLLDRNIFQVFQCLHDHSDDLLQMCRALEPALLRLPRLQKIELSHELRRPLRNWTSMRIEDYFPTLCKRGLIHTRCSAPPIQRHSDEVVALAVSPDSRWIASSSSDTTIILWDARHGTIIHEWLAHSNEVRSLSFSRDGRYLASAGEDRKVMVWDVSEEADAKLTTTLDDVDVCVWLRDGTMLAFEADEGTVHVWDPSTNHVQTHSLEGYSSGYDNLATLSPDGCWIAAVSQGTEDSVTWKIWDATTGGLHKVLPAMDEFDSPAAFDPAGQRIIIHTNRRNPCILDVETGDELGVMEDHGRNLSLYHVVFSPDGMRVLSTEWSDQQTMRLWDSSSGNILVSFEGHGTMIEQMCFSPDGKHVASASQDRTVKLWDTSDGSCIRTFTEHDREAVKCVAFSPDGEILVSGGDDGTVCIRRLRDVCPEVYSG